MKYGTVEQSNGTPTAEQLKKVNKFTRRELSADEVFVFSVILCDNEIDRDFERFTKQTLDNFKELFIGKTGIFDHSHKAQNQCARIFDTEVIAQEGKLTKAGDKYYKLKAYAYTVRSEQNKNLIIDIDAGIKKEVSVGCATAKRICSICGSENNSCMHRKGKVYRKNGKDMLCFHELDGATDAYEWSFVAVPAQVGAGVTKSFNKERKTNMSIEQLMKSFETEKEITLTEKEANELYKEFSDMATLSKAAEEYLDEQKQFIIKNICEKLDNENSKIFAAAMDKMSAQELIKLYRNAEKKEDVTLPQIRKQGKKSHKNLNRNFIV